MAQDFVGSNNINLLEPIGQFGTRLLGGKDAASPRYIFTKMSKMSNNIFDSKDNDLLKYLEDDGLMIEPEYYVPILPMVLVNGVEGIGTGYSTSIPCYNPEDIIDNLNRYMKNEPLKKMIPWYKGFKGMISQNSQKEHQYLAQGVYRMKSDTEVEITELPIGKWTSDYKEFLDDLAVKNKIKSYENHSGDTNIVFNVFTLENVQDFQKRVRKIKEDIKTLESKSKKDLWIKDLSELI
eukprot:gene18487-22064_t